MASAIHEISEPAVKKTQFRRINIYGGSGVGKSTTASDLFAHLKRMTVGNRIDFQVELCQEYVKQWAWEGRKPSGLDQWYIFANQHRAEYGPLKNGVDCVITDSPLILGCAYARKNHVEGWQQLIGLAEIHERMYPGLHIFLDRGDRPYVQKGRFEDEAGARKMDTFIRGMLDLFVGSERYHVLPYDDFDGLTKFVSQQVGLIDG